MAYKDPEAKRAWEAAHREEIRVRKPSPVLVQPLLLTVAAAKKQR